ncbi:MAG: AmmeMemoRadiSam system protein B [bacterium]
MPNRIKLYIFLLSLPMVAGLIIVGIFFKIKLDKMENNSLREGQCPEGKGTVYSSVPFDLEFYEAAFAIGGKRTESPQSLLGDCGGTNGVRFGCRDGACPVSTEIVAGIAPHHLLAADMIAKFYLNLSCLEYDTIILIGPNHFDAGDYDIAVSEYDWETPYGTLEADRESANAIVETGHCHVSTNEDIFRNEHSINSHAAFVKKIFPNTKFLPIILKSSLDSEQAKDLAEKIYAISKDKKILVLASIDFSHYKNSIIAQANDKTSINAIENSSFDKIYGLDIDSPASLYAIMNYSRIRGAEFKLLNNSNSAILVEKPELAETTSYVTGYFMSGEDDISDMGEVWEPRFLESHFFEPHFLESCFEGGLPQSRQNIRMLFFGDLMLDRYVGEKIKKNGIEYLFENLDKENFLQGYNLISANLEGAVTNGGKHYEPAKAYDFAFAPSIIEELKKYNFNFFNIANNHLDDQGIQGVNETRENLDLLEFNYSGCVNGEVGECSVRIVEAQDTETKTSPNPSLLRMGNRMIGMVGISAVWDKIDLEKVHEMLVKLKEESDLIVVNIHWGNEYETKFNKIQQEIACDFIDYGADIIIGHHPHVVQGIEWYNGRRHAAVPSVATYESVYSNDDEGGGIIFYSLGNFIFDQYFSKETQEGFAVEVTLKNGELAFLLHPFKSQQSKVELMAGEERENFLQSLSTFSVGDGDFLEQVNNGQILAKFYKD